LCLKVSFGHFLFKFRFCAPLFLGGHSQGPLQVARF
jgi:hypothetical protein